MTAILDSSAVLAFLRGEAGADMVLGLALTRRLRGAFYTADHHELDALKAANGCAIEFIR